MLQRGRLGSLHHPSREISLACEHAALDVARPILVSHRPCAGLQAYGVEQSFEDLAVEAIRSLPDDELLDDVAAVVRKRPVREPLGRRPASGASVVDRARRLPKLLRREVLGVPLEYGTPSRTIGEFVRALLVAASKLAHEGPARFVLAVDRGKQGPDVRRRLAIHL